MWTFLPPSDTMDERPSGRSTAWMPMNACSFTRSSVMLTGATLTMSTSTARAAFGMASDSSAHKRTRTTGRHRLVPVLLSRGG
jgi:hypothetical protein